MLDITPRKILVGVSGEEDSTGAVAFAVAEARRRATGVHLVHVVHPVLISPDGVPITVEERAVRKLGREALDAAAAVAEHQLGSGHPVTTEIVRGRTAEALVEAAQHAALVVLQHQRMGQGRQWVPTLSTTNPVAALSPTPVVAVPSGWHDSSEPDVVTVGVADPERSQEVVRRALEEARLWGATLRIVHAWHYSDAYDDVIFVGNEQNLTEERALRDGLSDLLAAYPDVVVDVVVQHARAADALVHESDRSALVIIGRHRHAMPLGPHLGSVARAVLRHASCPVMVVDPVPTIVDEPAATTVAAVTTTAQEA